MENDEQRLPPPPASRSGSVDAARKRRLAAALRENLKRRKAQARERANQDRVPPVKDD